MKILNFWQDSETCVLKHLYVTVELSENEFVEVCFPDTPSLDNLDPGKDYSYVMECQSGGQVYTGETNEAGIGVRSLSDDEYGNVLKFVDDNILKFIKNLSEEREVEQDL